MIFSKNNKKPRPVVLVVMDGVGIAPPSEGNAVTNANTPNLDKYWPTYPHGNLEASGTFVGLPPNVDGNSEVGHTTLGAGKIIWQDLPRINKAIEDESFFQNPKLLQAFIHAEKNNSKVHIIGLTGTGFVHASVGHLYALIDMAVARKFDPDRLYIHAFLDGRDSATDAGIDVLTKIEEYTLQKNCGVLSSFIGRAIAMDRNKNWQQTQKAYEMLTQGKGRYIADWKKELEANYKKDISDEYIPATIISKDQQNANLISDNDAIIFFNYRPDRAQQLTRAFIDDNFPGFEREMLKNLYFVGFSDYKKGFPKNIAFPAEPVLNSLGRVLAEAGKTQLRVAESEKFPHVTYFFNGGNGSVHEGEKWLEVPSPKDVSTYDQKPEMSMRWVTDIVVENIKNDDYDFILVNFAAPDMVAHTGNIEASEEAMTVCDESIGRIVHETLKQEGAVIITADHGNAEELINLDNGEPDTKHSTAQVPILIIKKEMEPTELQPGGLADVAPTILTLMGIEIPPEMTGRTLL